jgi:putative RNA 2'-phosphotransferase
MGNQKNNFYKTSKFLSFVLRHKPEELNLEMSEDGWVSVDELVDNMNLSGKEIDVDILNEIVETNDKKRFEFNSDGSMIRASQGHSINVALGYDAVTPPPVLFHGTVQKALAPILKSGLNKMSRDHVHLSDDYVTAFKVGSRRGKAVILLVDSKRMHNDGYSFYKSTNGVWLTDRVPSEYLEIKN